jgi:alkylation response protein AidB-like acyl-CoA dehydrogenase
MSTAIESAGLSDTQRQIVELARDFARDRIEPRAAEWDRTAQLPRDVLTELGALGFLGMATPEADDGMGLDTLTYLLALEEFAAADAALAVTVGIQHAVQSGLLLPHGTVAQRERWVRPLARGEIVAGIALAEADAGSDAAAIRAQAVRQGDTWVLSGAKAWVTNGATADVVIVMARTAVARPEADGRGISAFIVPTDIAGYRPGERVDTMGMRASNIVSVTLDDVRLPTEHLLGEEGSGFTYAIEGLTASRLGTAIVAVGIARRAFEHVVAYCAERHQFGRALREFEAVQFKMADMATRLNAARALAHTAAVRRDRGEEITWQASMAKLLASEAAMWVTTQAVQLFGGYGYMRDFPVEKLFRDAKGTEILDGTSEMQRLVIARGLYPSR